MTLVCRVPGSKSMTQRALLIAALAEQPVRLVNALRCDDSARLTELLSALGVGVTWREDEVEVLPATPLRSSGASVFCGNAGTTVRFGTCLSLLVEGELVIDGDERMRERPLGPLGRSLSTLGCQVRYLAKEGYPPLAVRRGGPIPPAVDVDSSLSSQFASGLALVAPRLAGGLELRLSSGSVSLPYLQMTSSMMERAGASVTWEGSTCLRVAPGAYFARGQGCLNPVMAIEADWSGAAFMLAAGLVSRRDIVVPGVVPPEASLQGDAVFSRFMEELSHSREHFFDLSDCPDLIAPLVAAALFASHATRIRGAAHTRIKESDRIAVLCRELAKVGARIVEHADGMDVFPLTEVICGEHLLQPELDHRMAMAFAVVSLRVPGIRVAQPECVSKSFPGFWTELKRIREEIMGE